jgi:tetratricopeptide (TPR) repeat protein
MKTNRLARSLSAAFLVAVFLMLAVAQAQTWPPLSAAAEESLQRGEEAAALALQTYSAQYPDRPLWQEAFRYAEEAIQLAPNNPEPYRFQALAYSRANWFGPAWRLWQQYLERGFPLDAEATPVFVDVGQRTAYSAYEQGDLRRALQTYQMIINEVPFDLEAQGWAGRILMELGEPEQAISYWSTVAERDPRDGRAAYFLQLARDQARWGVDAANAFREGVAFYEQQDLTQARERFARATSLNGSYTEAWAWFGRVAFERGNFQDARTYYQRAMRLAPDNATYRYFFEEAGRRLAD